MANIITPTFLPVIITKSLILEETFLKVELENTPRNFKKSKQNIAYLTSFTAKKLQGVLASILSAIE